MEAVGVRELRQNLSRHLARVKDGESLVVTERGHEVALLVPSGENANRHARLAVKFGATVPVARLEQVAANLTAPGAPAGTTDAYLAESRAPRNRAR
ncbi:MAG: type II toxin-antitoxin system Phd/YefM family antitoxin [Solirubrobacterales bacterium]